MTKLVWWLPSARCDIISELIHSKPEAFGNILSEYIMPMVLGLSRPRLASSVNSLPEYIKTQVASLSGRVGRGRLWVSEVVAPASIDNWDNTKPLAAKASGCGGIVIREGDAAAILPLIKQGYGFLTDMNLDSWPQS